MINDEELKDMADRIELPIKEGTWDFIETQIPHYPTSKRFLLYWRSFALAICVFALAITTAAYYTNKDTKSTNNQFLSQLTDISTDQNQTSGSNSITPGLPDTQLSEPQTNLNPTTAITTTKVNAAIGRKNGFRNYKFVEPIVPEVRGSQTTLNDNSYDETTNRDHSTIDIDYPSDGGNSLNSYSHSYEQSLYDQSLKIISLKPRAFSYILDANKVNLLKTKQPFKYFIQLNYGLLNSNIYINPELMKLPKGKGSEINLYNGVAYKKWSFSLGLHYAKFTQTTSMGEKHDTTYYQVFKPNFETVLPSEYKNRLHDTSNLYLSGTNHNTVEQNFTLLGLSMNVGRTLLKYDNFSMSLHYGANYKLLKKANTFFYDSINKAAVPFTQNDKGIVFKNLLSSRVQLGFNYNINSHVSLNVSPFVDYFHKPFIKHYYKADFLNYGATVGATYSFR